MDERWRRADTPMLTLLISLSQLGFEHCGGVTKTSAIADECRRVCRQGSGKVVFQ